MSARRIVTLHCDRGGCIHFFTYDVSPDGATWKPPRITDARREAGGFGWRSGVRPRVDAGPAPTVDFCPDHAADIQGDGISEIAS